LILVYRCIWNFIFNFICISSW